jgi:hypothetical protein
VVAADQLHQFQRVVVQAVERLVLMEEVVQALQQIQVRVQVDHTLREIIQVQQVMVDRVW